MAQFTDDKFIERAVIQYSGMITRIAFQYTKNKSEAEDIMQDVFIQFIKQPHFETDKHLKHWFIRTSINKSKDYLRSAKRRNSVPLDNNYSLPQEYDEVFNELQKLPGKDRNILYLFYYEGYSAKEIADILGKNESAIFMRLNRVRGKLKKILEE